MGLKAKKAWLDIMMILAACLWVAVVWYFEMPVEVVGISLLAALLLVGFCLIDCFKQLGATQEWQSTERQSAAFCAHELILLNEDETPIRSWDLAGKTAVIIGRQYKDVEVDIDLSGCEYGALVQAQHAVMNYSLDSWYLEGLDTKIGIQIRKADDGRRYQVASNRPCKITAGDVIYIARTKLLFT